jgi:hypothetical protein
MSNIIVLNHLIFQNEFGSEYSYRVGDDFEEYFKIKSMFERFSKYKTNSNNELSIFNEFIPVPKDIDNTNDWCQKNWGTKKDAFNIKVDDIYHSVRFTTYNDEPYAFLKSFSKMHPSYKMIHTVKIIKTYENDHHTDLELYTQLIYNGNINTFSFDQCY